MCLWIAAEEDRSMLGALRLSASTLSGVYSGSKIIGGPFDAKDWVSLSRLYINNGLFHRHGKKSRVFTDRCHVLPRKDKACRDTCYRVNKYSYSIQRMINEVS